MSQNRAAVQSFTLLEDCEHAREKEKGEGIMDFRKKFVVKPGAKVKLGDIDPAYKGEHESHQSAAAGLRATPQASRDCNTNSTPKTSVRYS